MRLTNSAMARPLGSKLVGENSVAERDQAETQAGESKTTHHSTSSATTSRRKWLRAMAMVVLTSTGLAIVAARRLNRRR